MLRSVISTVNSLAIGILTILGVFFVLLFLLNFLVHLPSRWTKTETLATGEILTQKIAVYWGMQGDSTINDLYFQNQSGAPVEHLGQIHERDLPMKDAKVFRKQGMPVLLAMGRHIFHHSLNKEKSSWWEITMVQNGDAGKFLAACVKGGTPKWFPPLWGYVFDSASYDLREIVMKIQEATPGMPTYLIYSTDTSVFANQVGQQSPEYRWDFDLEKTRSRNGFFTAEPFRDSAGCLSARAACQYHHLYRRPAANGAFGRHLVRQYLHTELHRMEPNRFPWAGCRQGTPDNTRRGPLRLCGCSCEDGYALLARPGFFRH